MFVGFSVFAVIVLAAVLTPPIAVGVASCRVIGPALQVRLTERFTALPGYRYNSYEDANPAIRGSAGLRFQFAQ